MKFGDLKAFCAVANHGTLQLAAQVLKLTTGAVSLQLKRLEKDVGIKLFQRTPNKLLLTDDGRTFLNQTQILLREFERGIASIREGDAGSIIVSSVNDMAQFLAPRIAGFIRDNPSVNVSILSRSPSESLELVLKGEADFGIGRFLSLPPSINPVRLFTAIIVALFPKDHSLSRVKRLTLQDLLSYDLIVLPHNSAARSTIGKAFLSKGLELKKVLEAGGCSIIKEYVDLRLGVGLVHEICIRGKKGSLCTIDAGHLFDPYDIVLIHRADRPPGRVQKRFIESLSQERSPKP